MKVGSNGELISNDLRDIVREVVAAIRDIAK